MKKLFTLLILLMYCSLIAQHVPNGINFQGLARDPLFQPISNQSISIRISIYDSINFSSPDYQEIQNTTTNNFGLFSLIIGKGNVSGNSNYSSLLQLDWSISPRFMTIEVDAMGGSNYLIYDTVSLVSVPYSLFSESAGTLVGPMSIGDLADVDTSGIAQGKVLTWNGTFWTPSYPIFSDSVLYANYAQASGFADTAMVAYQLLNPIDSVIFSNHSDSSQFSFQSLYSSSSQHSVYSDTAQVAINCINSTPYWQLSGNNSINPSTDFIGTLNSVDLIFKTNSIERARITSSGRFGIGTNSPLANLHVEGNNGVVFTGTFGQGNIPITGPGTRLMWYPKKSAFRVGSVTAAQWDDNNIGNYSFATGLDNISRGNYSFSAGQSNAVYNDYGIGMGWSNNVSGVSAAGIGSANVASGFNAIALGRANTASDSISIAMGYHSISSGTASISMGAYANASGNFSIAMGYYANTNNFPGSFVFADFSSTTPTMATAPNQFVSRAAGGYYLYSSGNLASGVSLPSGSGSWNSLSDRNKKKNIRKIDYSSLLEKFRRLEVTEWSYISQQDQIRHIGPMAQDFYSLFALGESDSTISMIDIDGVNMAVLKQLEFQTSQLSIEVKKYKDLVKKYEQLKVQNDILQKRIDRMETLIMNRKE